jgi:hypothetical protein
LKTPKPTLPRKKRRRGRRKLNNEQMCKFADMQIDY